MKKTKMQKNIYLDHASAAPLDAEVFSVMKKYFLGIGANPSALHKEGLIARSAVEDARKKIAQIINARPNEIIFTGSGTESNNLAISGVLNTPRPAPHIITTNIEHPSVLEVCKYLEKSGKAKVTYVEVEKNGIVDPKKIRAALKPNTVLVSVIYANNEIGTIQPIVEIAKEIRHYRKTRQDLVKNTRSCLVPLFHIDACQAINYLPVNVEKLGVDLMTFNASKIYGPKGVGALYKKGIVDISPIIQGGGQEFGLRSGTENVAGIVGFAKAMEIAESMKEKESKRLIKLRDYFFIKLQKNSSLASVVVNGDIEKRLPNNVNISVPGIESELLVIELDAHGIAVSSRSACKTNDSDESYVIEALHKDQAGKKNDLATEEGSIRFSLGRATAKADIDATLKALKQIIAKLKKWYNL